MGPIIIFHLQLNQAWYTKLCLNKNTFWAPMCKMEGKPIMETLSRMDFPTLFLGFGFQDESLHFDWRSWIMANFTWEPWALSMFDPSPNDLPPGKIPDILESKFVDGGQNCLTSLNVNVTCRSPYGSLCPRFFLSVLDLPFFRGGWVLLESRSSPEGQEQEDDGPEIFCSTGSSNNSLVQTNVFLVSKVE